MRTTYLVIRTRYFFVRTIYLSSANKILSCRKKILCCPNKLLSCSNKIFSCRNNLKSKTNMSHPRFRTRPILNAENVLANIALGKTDIKTNSFFLISSQNILRGYSLEAPLRGTSNEYPQHNFCEEMKRKKQNKKKTHTHTQCTLVTTTEFVPKNVAITINAVEQNTNWAVWYVRQVLFSSYFLKEQMFWIFVRIASIRRF